MQTKQNDFIAGARDSLPILLGVVPFALICSVAAVSVGLTPFEAMGMSFIVFAGASQLAVLQLMGQGAFWLVMVLTARVINLRFTMYSATLAPYLQKEPMSRKAPFAYILSDQAFGVSMSHFANEIPANPAWYYYGAAADVWVTWNTSAAVGALLGTLVPESWGLDFAFPLSFMALMFAALNDRPTVLAALVGGLVAVLVHGLPYNLGLVLAALLGIGAGVLAESVSSKEAQGVLE
jgi:predicted branched-subunit amino acid permease